MANTFPQWLEGDRAKEMDISTSGGWSDAVTLRRVATLQKKSPTSATFRTFAAFPLLGSSILSGQPSAVRRELLAAHLTPAEVLKRTNLAELLGTLLGMGSRLQQNALKQVLELVRPLQRQVIDQLQVADASACHDDDTSVSPPLQSKTSDRDPRALVEAADKALKKCEAHACSSCMQEAGSSHHARATLAANGGRPRALRTVAPLQEIANGAATLRSLCACHAF